MSRANEAVRAQGADPLKGQNPLKDESFLAFARSKDRQICPFLLIFGKQQIDRQLENTLDPGTLVMVDILI